MCSLEFPLSTVVFYTVLVVTEIVTMRFIRNRWSQQSKQTGSVQLPSSTEILYAPRCQHDACTSELNLAVTSKRSPSKLAVPVKLIILICRLDFHTKQDGFTPQPSINNDSTLIGEFGSDRHAVEHKQSSGIEDEEQFAYQTARNASMDDKSSIRAARDALELPSLSRIFHNPIHQHYNTSTNVHVLDI